MPSGRELEAVNELAIIAAVDGFTTGSIAVACLSLVSTITGALFLRWVDRRQKRFEKEEAEKLEWRAGVIQAIADHEKLLDTHRRWFNYIRDHLIDFPLE